MHKSTAMYMMRANGTRMLMDDRHAVEEKLVTRKREKEARSRDDAACSRADERDEYAYGDEERS